MAKQISGGRQVAYYFGGFLSLVGLIMFISVFFSAATSFGDIENLGERAKNLPLRAISGFVMIVVGGVIRGIGARGIAGSGIVLDTERARDELEPYSRMAGGMAKDALDEADINIGGRSEPKIMLRCRSCEFLNEENSKFCQECGEAI